MNSISLNNGKWRQFSRSLNEQKGFYPNSIFFNADDGEVAVVIEKSARGDDFALSQKALDYVMAAQAKQDKPLRSFVVLRYANAIVGTMPAADVWGNLCDECLQDGRFGPFWWINKEFKRSTQEIEVDPIF